MCRTARIAGTQSILVSITADLTLLLAQEVIRQDVAVQVALQERLQAALQKAQSELNRLQQHADQAHLVSGRGNAVEDTNQKAQSELSKLRELQRKWDALATAAARLLEFSAALRADESRNPAYTLLDRKRQVETLWRAWKQAGVADIAEVLKVPYHAASILQVLMLAVGSSH